MLFASRKLKKIIGDAPKQNLEHFFLYNLKLNDIAVNLYVSKKRATKPIEYKNVSYNKLAFNLR